MTYEVKGEPTYFLAECFQTMIQGLVSSVNQREEHQQREFLAMMSSTDGTIENAMIIMRVSNSFQSRLQE